MLTVVRWLCAAALVFVLGAFIAGVVHACERYHYDGYTLWCCSATEARPCAPIKGVGAEVRT